MVSLSPAGPRWNTNPRDVFHIASSLTHTALHISMTWKITELIKDIGQPCHRGTSLFIPVFTFPNSFKHGCSIHKSTPPPRTSINTLENTVVLTLSFGEKPTEPEGGKWHKRRCSAN